jgi:hypothetical protein
VYVQVDLVVRMEVQVDRAELPFGGLTADDPQSAACASKIATGAMIAASHAEELINHTLITGRAIKGAPPANMIGLPPGLRVVEVSLDTPTNERIGISDTPIPGPEEREVVFLPAVAPDGADAEIDDLAAQARGKMLLDVGYLPAGSEELPAAEREAWRDERENMTDGEGGADVA